MIKNLSLNNLACSTYRQRNFLDYKLILCSFLFALIFVNIPWEMVKGGGFSDIENYAERFTTGFNISSLINQGKPLSYITTEYLWAFLILKLQGFGLPILLLFKYVSLISILVFSYFVFKKSQNLLLASLLLINPLLIDFVMSQIRNSFALSVIILGLLCQNKWIKLILLVCSTMIHSSSIVIIFLIFSLNTIHSEKKYRDLGLLFLVAFTFAIALSVGRGYILDLIGDRRADIKQPQSSILYSLFWVFYIILLLYLKKFLVKDIYIRISFVLVFVFFASVVFGTYASRYLAILLPFLVISILSLNKRNKNFASGVLLSYQLILFTYWVN